MKTFTSACLVVFCGHYGIAASSDRIARFSLCARIEGLTQIGALMFGRNDNMPRFTSSLGSEIEACDGDMDFPIAVTALLRRPGPCQSEPALLPQASQPGRQRKSRQKGPRARSDAACWVKPGSRGTGSSATRSARRWLAASRSSGKPA